MRRANGLKCKTVAFSLLSAGNRLGRQSLDNVLTVAVKAIGDMAYPGLQRVHLVAHSSTEQEALQRVLLSLSTARAVLGFQSLFQLESPHSQLVGRHWLRSTSVAQM